jgi:hypothetical protein
MLNRLGHNLVEETPGNRGAIMGTSLTSDSSKWFNTSQGCGMGCVRQLEGAVEKRPGAHPLQSDKVGVFSCEEGCVCRHPLQRQHRAVEFGFCICRQGLCPCWQNFRISIPWRGPKLVCRCTRSCRSTHLYHKGCPQTCSPPCERSHRCVLSNFHLGWLQEGYAAVTSTRR